MCGATLVVMARRSYRQYCSIARTLDVVGERWTLLVVRELLTGPKRFKDFEDALHGIGTGLLSARLRFLEDEGLIRSAVLPPPARTPVYELTEAGRDLEPVVLALARWGMSWAADRKRRDETFRPGWAVLALQAIFDAEAAADVVATYEFDIDGEVFHVGVERGTIAARYGPAPRSDVRITLGRAGFLDLVGGASTLRQAVRAGNAAVDGDRAAAGKLATLFRWPKAGARTS